MSLFLRLLALFSKAVEPADTICTKETASRQSGFPSSPSFLHLHPITATLCYNRRRPRPVMRLINGHEHGESERKRVVNRSSRCNWKEGIRGDGDGRWMHGYLEREKERHMPCGMVSVDVAIANRFSSFFLSLSWFLCPFPLSLALFL